MKKILLILLLSITASLSAQKDTLYFNSAWNKTVKADASYFRPLPLKKVGNLYHVKGYHINGTLQMKGTWSDVDKEIFHGKVIYYYKNGKKYEEGNYEYGTPVGVITQYANDGLIRAQGEYKDGNKWKGTFDFLGTIKEFNKGQRIADKILYKGTSKVAQINKYDQNVEVLRTFFDQQGNKIGEVSIADYEFVTGKSFQFSRNDSEGVLEITSEITFKDSKMHGQQVFYSEEGKELARGTNKDGLPWDGSFFNERQNSLTTYKDGKLHGELIVYNTDSSISSKTLYEHGKKGFVTSTANFKNKICECQYKDSKPYEGQVCENDLIKTYKNGSIVRNEKYNDNKLVQITEYYNEKISKQITNINKTPYQLMYKNGKPFNGVKYDIYFKNLTTYSNGKKQGPFIEFKGYKSTKVEGNNNNNGKWHGKIRFTSYDEKLTTNCTYSNGKPLNGKTLLNNKYISYLNGKKQGVEAYKFEYYTTIKNEVQKVYDSISQNYVKDSLDGAINYFKSGQIVASGVYKNNKPFNGTFYENKRFENKYSQGILMKSIYRNSHFFIQTSYEDNHEFIIFEDTLIAKGTLVKRLPHNGTFVTLNDNSYPTTYTLKRYVNGKHDGITKSVDINTKSIINKKEYKAGVLINENWPFKFKNSSKVEGKYKNGKPYEGSFYNEDDIIGIFNNYKKGVKDGNQYFATKGSKMGNLLDSISYLKGKPITGGELEMYKSQTHQHIYENGKLLKTNIHLFGFSDKPHGEIIYTPNGFTTSIGHTVLKKQSEVSFLNSNKTSGTIVIYNDKEKIGHIEFKKSKILTAYFLKNKLFRGVNFHVEKSNIIVAKHKNDIGYIKIYPDINIPNQPDYTFFYNLNKLLIGDNAMAYFYLNNKKEAVCKLNIKDGKPYDGTFFNYLKNDNSFNYKKYKKGELFQEKDGLTEKELLKIVNK